MGPINQCMQACRQCWMKSNNNKKKKKGRAASDESLSTTRALPQVAPACATCRDGRWCPARPRPPATDLKASYRGRHMFFKGRMATPTTTSYVMGLRRQGQARGAGLESRLLLKYYCCAQKIQSLSELGFILPVCRLPWNHCIYPVNASLPIASTLYLSLLFFLKKKRSASV